MELSSVVSSTYGGNASTGTNMNFAVTALPPLVVLSEPQQLDPNGNNSTLSPFAEPFLPRSSSSSSSSSSILQPLEVDVSDSHLSIQLSSSAVNTPQLQNLNKNGFQKPVVGLAAEGLTVQPGTQSLLMLQRSGWQRDVTGDILLSSDSVSDQQEGVSNSQSMDAGQETRGEAYCERNVEDLHLLMLTKDLQPSRARLDSLPVGYERERKQRSLSQSSVSSLESTSSFFDTTDEGRGYSMFGGPSVWNDPLDSFDETSADVGRADFWSDGSSYFSSPFRGSSSGIKVLSRLPQLNAGKKHAAHSLSKGNGSDNGTLKKTGSSTDDLIHVSPTNKKTKQHRRSFSTSDLGHDANENQTSQLQFPDLIPRSRSNQNLNLFGSDTHLNAEDKGSEDSGCSSENDVEKTLLADSLTDENGNVFDFCTEGNTTVVDVNANIVEVPQVRYSLCRDRALRGSVDSGIGSVSEHPCLVNLPELETHEETTWVGGSPERSLGRCCGIHADQALSMYCTDCCQTLCATCFAADHSDCGRVLSTSLACRDLRWKLLKMQTAVGSHIHGLESKVRGLKPQVEGMAQSKETAKNAVNDQLKKLLEEVHARHQQVLEELEREFKAMEDRTQDSIVRAQKSLLLLNYVSQFLEVLRQQDSGWQLLATFDRRLSHLLQNVVQMAENSLGDVLLPEPSVEQEPDLLSDCQKTAFSVLSDVLELDDEESAALSSTSTWSENTGLGKFSRQDSGFDASSDTDAWTAKSDGTSDNNAENNFLYSIRASKQERSSVSFGEEEGLMREIFTYMQRFPPPAASTSSTSSTSSTATFTTLRLPSKPSLYDEMIDTLSPEDLIDDVFHFDEVPQQHPPSSDVFSTAQKHVPEEEEEEEEESYKVHQRLWPHFPQDVEKSFVADLHVTETGRLVFLDAANQCLKRVDLQPTRRDPARLPVSKPLSMCSAGWDRVMVSCSERKVSVYSIGRRDIQLVLTRPTRQQYRGLVRASDALVAAASPETHSVDLLDLGGRVLRSIMPVDFVRGPEVVGSTTSGELLVVYQPAQPPTCIVCFDMAGAVLWTHRLHVTLRHVSCCKVIGGADGSVYYALQGDSMVYRFWPGTGEVRALLTSRHGAQFPSSLALDQDGQVFVPRNELPSVHFASSGSQPMLPATTEIDVFGKE